MKLLLITLLRFSLQILTSDSVKTASPQERLQIRIDSLSKSQLMQSGTVGISIKSVISGQKILEYNSRKSLTPASTMKLVSSATALMTLGEDFTYQTTLEFSGQVTDSVLLGNIYIKGSGDPSLGSWRFKGRPDYKQLTDIFAYKIKALGIREIKGSIIGDGSLFEENVIPDQWNWGDIGNYYGAGCGGLNINENLFYAVFKPGAYLEPASLTNTLPDLPYYAKLNKVLTDRAGTKDQVMIYSSPYQDVIVLQGFVPSGSQFSVKGSLPDPALFSAFFLKKRLEELKITVTEGATSLMELNKRNLPYVRPLKTTPIYTQVSPTLAELAKECNTHSINLYAEAFLKTPAVFLNLGNTTEAALKGMSQIWMSKGIDLSGFMPKDGSGLSPSGGITTDNMTEILKYMKSEKSFGAFYNSIPVLGVSGTVASLGKRSKAAGNVRAKSGSIEGVRAYAGYFTSKSGELMTFSIILNRYNGNASLATKELEKLMIMMVDL